MQLVQPLQATPRTKLAKELQSRLDGEGAAMYWWSRSQGGDSLNHVDLITTNKIASRFCERRGWKEPEYVDHGASAAVYKVEIPGKGLAALKIYDPKFFYGDNAPIETRRCELQAGLKNHGHPNLIDVIDVGHIPEDATWFLLMEYCPWPSMEKQLTNIPDDCIPSLIKQLAEAVIFLSGFGPGYVHRDIKPANIAVSNDFSTLKLLDLGVLRKSGPDEGNGTDDDNTRRFIATAQYSPPEFLTREEPPGSDGYDAINVYQIGAVLHDMIMKEPLFFAEKITRNRYILFKAVSGKTPRVRSRVISARLVYLCRQSLVKDPNERIARVRVDDFAKDADDADTIRRRIIATSHTPATPAPSLQVWRTQVRSWIGAAARLEADSLGAYSIKEQPCADKLSWRVTFENVRTAAALVHLIRRGSTLYLEVVNEGDPPLPAPVVEISSDGPDLTPAEISSALAAQILYALDLGQSAHNGTLRGDV